MKKLTSLLAALVFASIFTFTSCGGSDEPKKKDDTTTTPVKTAKELAAEKLVKTWKVTVADVKYNDGASEGDWSALTLTFTGNKDGGTYTVAGTPAGYERVWPASGTWKFDGDSVTKLTRDDNVSIDVVISDDKLTAQFNIVEELPGRTNGIVGKWNFTFTK